MNASANRPGNPEGTRSLFIDIRMARHSGIGTYIRNVVGRIAGSLSSENITLLGDTRCAALFSSIKSHPFDASIYSLREQILPLRMGVGRSDGYWCPHYNIPALLNARQIVTIHDTFHLAMPQFTGTVAKRAYASLLFQAVAARSDRIICVSRSTADELLRLTRVNANKLEVIHNGVDDFWFGGTQSASPVAYPYFLFVGNVKPHKNLRRLLAAYRLVRQTLADHRLIIVGKKEGFITGDRESLREAESLGDSVAFTGYIADEELRRYFKHAEALVFPSLYEGFGLPILEAMAANCPVVASDLKVHREIGGDVPLFCDPNSEDMIAAAMREVAALSAVSRAQISVAGVQHARSFTWDRCASETASVIEEVLSR